MSQTVTPKPPAAVADNTPLDPKEVRQRPAVLAVYAGQSLRQAAAAHGIPHPTLNRWVNSVRDAFGDEGLPASYTQRSAKLRKTTTKVYSYPILARVPAGGFNGAPLSPDDLLGTYGTDLHVPVRNGKEPFAFKVHGDSMTNPAASPTAPANDPNFPNGIFVLCDPSAFPDPGDFVVVVDATDESMTLKKLVNRDPEGRDLWLTPLNPAFSPIQYDDSVHQLVGVVVDAMMPMFRKATKTGRRQP